jgi:hypothetical protein
MVLYNDSKFVPTNFIASDLDTFSALLERVSQLEAKVQSLQEQLNSLLPPQVYSNNETTGREL